MLSECKLPNSPFYINCLICTYLHSIHSPYDPLNFQNNIYAQNNVTNVLIPKLEALSPVQGAYLNEANMHQPNFQSVFYGNNYQALKSIKNKYDPSSTFYGLTAVGSDDWTVDSVTGRLCPVS